MFTAPASPNSGKGLGTGNSDPCSGVDSTNGIKLPPKGHHKRANVDGTGNTNFKLGTTKGDHASMKTVKQKRRGGNYLLLLFHFQCHSMLSNESASFISILIRNIMCTLCKYDVCLTCKLFFTLVPMYQGGSMPTLCGTTTRKP